MDGTHNQEVTANLHHAHDTMVLPLISDGRTSAELHHGAMDGVEGERQGHGRLIWPISIGCELIVAVEATAPDLFAVAARALV